MRDKMGGFNAGKKAGLGEQHPTRGDGGITHKDG